MDFGLLQNAPNYILYAQIGQEHLYTFTLKLHLKNTLQIHRMLPYQVPNILATEIFSKENITMCAIGMTAQAVMIAGGGIAVAAGTTIGLTSQVLPQGHRCIDLGCRWSRQSPVGVSL